MVMKKIKKEDINLNKLSKELSEERKNRKAIYRLLYALNSTKNFSIKLKLLGLFSILIFSFSFGSELTGNWIFKSIKGTVFVSGVSGYKIPAKFNSDGTVEIGKDKMFNLKKYYEFDGNILKIWIGTETKRNLSTTILKVESFDGSCYRLTYIKSTVKNKFGVLLCKDL